MPFCKATLFTYSELFSFFISRQKRKNQRTTTKSRVPLLRQRSVQFSSILFTRGAHYPSFFFFYLSFRVSRIFSKYLNDNIFCLSVQFSRSKNMETFPSPPAVCGIPVENFCSSLTLTTPRRINAGNGGSR